MGEIVGAAIVFGIAVVMAVNGWRQRDDSPLFILRLLPAALLVVSLPAWLAAIDMIRVFERIATTGDGGGGQVEALARSTGNALLVGLTGTIIAVGIAAALQAFATGVADSSDAPMAPAARVDTWLLVAPSLAVVPAAFIVATMRELTALVTLAARHLNAGDGVTEFAGLSVPELSEYLAQRLLQVLIAGGATNLALFALTPTLLFLARARRPRGALDVYSWGVMIVIVGAGAWGAYTMPDPGAMPALPAVR